MRWGILWLALSAIGVIAAAPLENGPLENGPLEIAPAEIGRWLTQDRSSVIAIAPCGLGLCGRIVGISLDHPTDPPPKDIWGGAQCNEIIIRMPVLGQDGRWRGTILDPRSGRNWRAQIWRQGDTLRLRGYIGLPLFGATQLWTAYAGGARANCDFDH